MGVLTQWDLQTLTADEGHYAIYDTTRMFCDGDVQPSDLIDLATDLRALEGLYEDDRMCVLFGYGCHHRTTYSELGRQEHLDVLWDGALLPRWAKLFSIVANAHGGLVRVRTPQAMYNAMMTLSNLAMVELFFCSATLLFKVISHVEERRWRSCIGKIIGRDESYFSFGVDGDCPSSSTNYYAWCSHGPKCPDALAGTASTWAGTA